MTSLVYRNNSLQYLPSYGRLRDFIMSISEKIEEMALNLIRIEHSLYGEYHTTPFLEVIIINIILHQNNLKC